MGKLKPLVAFIYLHVLCVHAGTIEEDYKDDIEYFEQLPETSFDKKLYSAAVEQDVSKRFQKLKTLLKDSDEYQEYLILPLAAKTAYSNRSYATAEAYAKRLLMLAPKYKGNWNYGNAIHDSNVVLGRVVLRNGELELAIEHLLKAGKTLGSPQLGSFGPNMELAKDLIEENEREAVLSYFELCRKFWDLGEDKLAIWTLQVNEGKMPDFGANLSY